MRRIKESSKKDQVQKSIFELVDTKNGDVRETFLEMLVSLGKTTFFEMVED